MRTIGFRIVNIARFVAINLRYLPRQVERQPGLFALFVRATPVSPYSFERH